MRTTHSYSTQRGATVIETSLVCVPLVLFFALLLELTNSQHVRHIAQLALYEAARAGSVSGARPQEIDQAFGTAILPLFAPPGMHETPARRRDVHAQHIAHTTGLTLWHIETLNPDSLVFRDFSDATLSRNLGRPALRIDYLAEQHQAHIKQGWQQGQGPLSGLNVFEANTLRLKLSLLYKPRMPGIALILQKLAVRRTDRTGVAWQKGYLVTELVTEVMMQSHAQHWGATAQNDGRVIKKDIAPFVSTPSQQYLRGKQAPSAVAATEVPTTISIPLSTSVSTPLQRSGRVDIANAKSERAVVNDLAKGNNVATVNNTAAVDEAAVDEVPLDGAALDDAALDDTATEEKQLCDGLLCCQ